jgi:hypothetical protein
MDSVVARLQIMEYFWCMHSCEYSDIQGECRTKLSVRKIRFFDASNRDITPQLDLHFVAAAASITFEFQKKDIQNESTSYQKSHEMCPVRVAAEVVKHIHTYNLPSDAVRDTPMNYIEVNGCFSIPSSVILQKKLPGSITPRLRKTVISP